MTFDADIQLIQVNIGACRLSKWQSIKPFSMLTKKWKTEQKSDNKYESASKCVNPFQTYQLADIEPLDAGHAVARETTNNRAFFLLPIGSKTARDILMLWRKRSTAVKTQIKIWRNKYVATLES